MCVLKYLNAGRSNVIVFFAHLVASKITIKSFRMLERRRKKSNLTCVKKPTVVYRPDSIMQKWFPSHSIRLQFLPCMLVPSHYPTAVLTNYTTLFLYSTNVLFLSPFYCCFIFSFSALLLFDFIVIDFNNVINIIRSFFSSLSALSLWVFSWGFAVYLRTQALLFQITAASFFPIVLLQFNRWFCFGLFISIPFQLWKRITRFNKRVFILSEQK